ncbi:methionine ABC transporter ATP-binding protein [Legionella sp. W05-934-2]|jgi:D-methionine transport system ATP-binding protein|uniref:methionine ABC transporter ATP-binding protein n=1 Tax=Legionella sp. W05-934-2 TaxID=1198649 RepID=UPI003462A8CC
MIELKHLSKQFNGKPALNDVNLLIQEGEIFGIIGKSGAGKSTLLRCMNLLEAPDSGQVIIDQQDITPLSGNDLRRARQKMAMIFQHFNLLANKTVFDNVALPFRFRHESESTIAERVDELLKLVGLDDKQTAYPSQLSGGQKQRVAIARALTTSPKVLLCDEATSALDPETTESILALLKQINQLYGITIVLITHEMEVIKRICHRLSVIEEGSLVETSSLSRVFKKEDSPAKALLFKQLSPELPAKLKQLMRQEVNQHPIIRLIFEGSETTVPFISQCSQSLNLDINILLANVDQFDNLTVGVLIVSLRTNQNTQALFFERCAQHHITVEVLGYVHADDF